MNIHVEQLGDSLATRHWVQLVFSEPSNLAALSEADRTPTFRRWLLEEIRQNKALALMPVVDNIAAGLFWGRPLEGNMYSVHQFVMPTHRKGLLSVQIAKACVAKAFELLKTTTHLMGITPVDNRAALLTAKRAGFVQVGVLPGFHDDKDCAILIRRRDDG